MKKLFIVRHAKSSWKNESLQDFYRPLNKRGEVNAPMMAQRLKGKNIFPDAIVSSPAYRAKSTALLLAKGLDFTKEIVYKKSLYEANIKTIEEILRAVDDKDTTLFLVGHNQELTFFAQKYVDFNENIVTCGVLEMTFDCNSWSEINKENASFISYDYPKNKS